MILTGTVTYKGFGRGGKNLEPVLTLIEERSGLSPLVPGTLNLALEAPYVVAPDFIVTTDEYWMGEELRFRHCRVGGLRCLIMRPEPHERGFSHGSAHLEIMSTVRLREYLNIGAGSKVDVDVGPVRQ